MDLSFPIREFLPEESLPALLGALTLVNKNLFADGIAALEGIQLVTLPLEAQLYIKHKIGSALF